MRTRLLLFIVIFGGASIYGWFDAKASMRSLAQKIMDDNIAGNTLSVDFIKIPIAMALPFSDYLISNGILFSEVDGYFTVKRKDKGNLADGCEFITPEYSARGVGDGQIAMQLSGTEMAKLHSCQS